jgi:Holliday junction resolvase
VTNPSKDRGDRAEREIAKLLAEHLGLDVRRQLGAGRTDDIGDLHGLPDCTCEVKSYRDVTRAIRDGLHDLAREQTNAGTRHGVVFVRRPGGHWIAVQPIDNWITMYRETL